MQRPLIVRFGALGDMVILTAAIRKLYQRFAMPVDVLASGKWSIPLLADQPEVADVYCIGSRRWPYWLSAEQQSLVRRLAKRGAGPTWIGESNDTKARALLQKAGWQSTDLCSVRELPPAEGERHYCEYMYRFAHLTPASLGGQPLSVEKYSDAYCALQVTPAARAELDAWLNKRSVRAPFILVQAGNKRTMRKGSRTRGSNTKYWPEENWAEVLRGLRQIHPQHALLLLGAPPEITLNDDILRLAAVTNAHNLADDLPLPRLKALAAAAYGMISVDTGPAHVAAAVGCKVVTLFGEMDPAAYTPRGTGVLGYPIVGYVNGRQSMLGISPSQVLASWQEACGEAIVSTMATRQR